MRVLHQNSSPLIPSSSPRAPRDGSSPCARRDERRRDLDETSRGGRGELESSSRKTRRELDGNSNSRGGREKLVGKQSGSSRDLAVKSPQRRRGVEGCRDNSSKLQQKHPHNNHDVLRHFLHLPHFNFCYNVEIARHSSIDTRIEIQTKYDVLSTIVLSIVTYNIHMAMKSNLHKKTNSTHYQFSTLTSSKNYSGSL